MRYRKADQKHLEALFAKFNKKYFNSVLPKNFAVNYSDLKGQGLGVTRFGVRYTPTKRGYRRDTLIGPIEIEQDLRKYHSIVATTLLHEMVHAANPKIMGHGKKFQAEMLRLAKAGAFDNFW